MSDLSIESEFPDGLLDVGHTTPGRFVLPSVRVALLDLQRELEGAYQPERMRDAYRVVPSADGGELVNESGVLFPSFVYGSAPHFPPWNDPDLVEWANARGIPPFLVALSVSRYGTPAHDEIPRIIESHEERIASSMVDGLDAYLRAVV